MQYKRVNLLFSLLLLSMTGLVAYADESVTNYNKSVATTQDVAVADPQQHFAEMPKSANSGLLDTGVTDAIDASEYRVQPGDVLHISVWHEPDLQLDTLVSPSGNISVPLIGQIQTGNKTINALKQEVTQRLEKFVPGADVIVSLKQILGNKIYVIGKVNRPGEFVLNRNVDVMQALSMAGGTTQFADVDEIIILRREQLQAQQIYAFDYDEVKKGENLGQNIILKSGDVVVVP